MVNSWSRLSLTGVLIAFVSLVFVVVAVCPVRGSFATIPEDKLKSVSLHIELSGTAVVDVGLLTVEDELVGSALFIPDASTALPARLVQLERDRQDKLIGIQDFEGVASDRTQTVFFVGA